MGTSLTERIRDWFERSPKARRAYRRLGADLDAVAAWVDSATRGELRDTIAARIDPPGRGPAPAQDALPTPPERPGPAARDEPSRARPPESAPDA